MNATRGLLGLSVFVWLIPARAVVQEKWLAVVVGC
jgi:hypothetical protein